MVSHRSAHSSAAELACSLASRTRPPTCRPFESISDSSQRKPSARAALHFPHRRHRIESHVLNFLARHSAAALPLTPELLRARQQSVGQLIQRAIPSSGRSSMVANLQTPMFMSSPVLIGEAIFGLIQRSACLNNGRQPGRRAGEPSEVRRIATVSDRAARAVGASRHRRQLDHPQGRRQGDLLELLITR